MSNEEEAIQAIRLLHGNAKGKANFLFLVNLKVRKLFRQKLLDLNLPYPLLKPMHSTSLCCTLC
ncbi:MAG: hypothetical protein IPP06_13420 [Saprospiraceae bacterium]|nr:hypothetical protein [Candidatus Vicinibacter affinis]